MHVVKNIYETATNDESREMYKVPPLLEDMAQRKWLGDKTGQGFYKKLRGEGEKEILTLDRQHHGLSPAAESADSPRWKWAKPSKTRASVCAPCSGPSSKASPATRRSNLSGALLSEMCLYAARRVPEISDHVEDVDRAMRWGFGWELGPFELLDALGVPAFAAQIKKEGRALPPVIERLLADRPRRFLPLAERRHLVSSSPTARRRSSTIRPA